MFQPNAFFFVLRWHNQGVGWIYQQTFIDSYSKVAMTKLYDRKNALVAADMLNDKVIPWFEDWDHSCELQSEPDRAF